MKPVGLAKFHTTSTRMSVRHTRASLRLPPSPSHDDSAYAHMTYVHTMSADSLTSSSSICQQSPSYLLLHKSLHKFPVRALTSIGTQLPKILRAYSRHLRSTYRRQLQAALLRSRTMHAFSPSLCPRPQYRVCACRDVPRSTRTGSDSGRHWQFQQATSEPRCRSTARSRRRRSRKSESRRLETGMKSSIDLAVRIRTQY
ncbi:hypothetical protein C8Q80DRAFT_1133045 [Daedaleopsis nitida]|nr:hypothetical protein C8Q80DRAFT_1133045 [Daedaleopsis nitida]